MKSTMLNRIVSPVSISLCIIMVAAMGTFAACDRTDVRLVTDDATGKTANGATLNGKLTSRGTSTYVDVSFEYGRTTEYGTTVRGVPFMLTSVMAFNAVITDLSPDTLYYYRAIGEDDNHNLYHGDPPKTFRTNTSSSTTTASSTAVSPHAITQASTTTMPSYTPTTQPVSTIVPTHVFIPDIAREWQWNLTVTVANGACAGEEGTQAPYTVQITENGDDVTISGFLARFPVRLCLIILLTSGLSHFPEVTPKTEGPLRRITGCY